MRVLSNVTSSSRRHDTSAPVCSWLKSVPAYDDNKLVSALSTPAAKLAAATFKRWRRARRGGARS
jgi:hypothetical protein